MANIVINAALSKVYADKAAGVASALRGKNIIGIMDVRPVKYTDKTRHIAGFKYDKNKRMFFLTSPKKADDVNIGIFVSTYDVEVVEGRVLAKEELTEVYELPSVAFKYEIGGYKDEIEKAGKSLAEIHPKKVDLKILVITAPSRAVVRNEKGFTFVCDFKSGRWYTMRPGTTKMEAYSLRDDELLNKAVFKKELPFPALDRKLYDDSSVFEYDKFNIEKHVLSNV